jgi:predicted transcriptional regulator
VKVIKYKIKSMQKVKGTLSAEQLHEDALMAEAEADIKAGRVYTQDEVKKMIEGWTME